MVERYADPAQQNALPFGFRSYYLQPWRAYSETLPASRLRNALGINLNVGAREAEATCAALEKAGFRHARIEYGWSGIAEDETAAPGASARLADADGFARILAACKRHHLRPLLLLNANHGIPGPLTPLTLHLARPGRVGDKTVYLAPADARRVVPGRTGFSDITQYKAAEVLITSADAETGRAILARALPKELAANTPIKAATLKYAPFFPTRVAGANGAGAQSSPEFERTMTGWLAYVRVLGDAAQKALGTENQSDAGFDFEVWNELTFGSDFLYIERYYDAPPAQAAEASRASVPSPLPPVQKEILGRTIAFARDPKNGLAGTGVCDGFASQSPFGAGSTSPVGLAALAKHPYSGVRRFPETVIQNRPVDAQGKPEGRAQPGRGWVDTWTPTYVAHFPESYLTGVQTEYLTRDLSPITNDIYGTIHGRAARPQNAPSGATPPKMWVTEVNLDLHGAVTASPGDFAAFQAQKEAAQAAQGFSADEVEFLRAKAILRYWFSFTSAGVDRVYFFAARDNDPQGLGLFAPRFWKTLEARPGGSAPNVLPDEEARVTSQTLQALRRIHSALGEAPGAPFKPRTLTLRRIAEDHGHTQFAGDPATVNQTPNPHPPLFNRECVAFYPYQTGANRFAVGLYVMTRNLPARHQPGASTIAARFTLPDETYRLTIGGVNGARARIANASLLDPITNVRTPVRVLGRTRDAVTVEVPLSDSVRLLVLED